MMGTVISLGILCAPVFATDNEAIAAAAVLPTDVGIAGAEELTCINGCDHKTRYYSLSYPVAGYKIIRK